MADKVILENLTKKFGEVTAVNNLCLRIEEGECFSFLGPSGCGKTTTLRMVAGFEDPTEGEIKVGGKLMSSTHKKIFLPPDKRKFGMVFQAFAVWPHLNVFDNVAFPLKIEGAGKSEIKEKVSRAIAHTGLTGLEESFPHELSGGQQQRIALARAITTRPEVLLLDEPLSNLDPKLREEMRFEIKDLQREYGFTIIYVTHDQAEAMALSDRMLVMNFGVVHQVDTPMSIYANPKDKFVFSFIGLSNFIPVEIVDGKIFIKDGRDCGSLVDYSIPEDIKGYEAILACRPNEIEMGRNGGIKGTVIRRVFLGDTIDYRVKVGDSEVRVQARRKIEFQEGEKCSLKFTRILWYPASD